MIQIDNLRTYSITEIREEITRLPEQFEQEADAAVAITRRGKPIMAILPFDVYIDV